MHKDSINQIIARLKRLEKAVLASDLQAGKEKKPKGPSREALPAHILALREGGFFKGPKTAIEVHAKLQSKYHCEPDRVAMALLRLQRGRKLRKSSKVVGKRKQVAYVW